MTGNIAVADKFLSFLPHSVSRAGGPVPVDASSMNPGFLTAAGVTRDDPLQKIVNRRVLEDGVARPKNPEFRNLRFALVDLTGSANLAAPKFAGHRETEQGGLGSLAKTACMAATFQLKFDLEELARAKGLTTETALFQAARDAWDDTQKPDPANVITLNASGPKIEQSGKLILINDKKVVMPRGLAAPDLERIFTVKPDGSGGVTVRFKGDDVILVDPATLRGLSPPVPPPPQMSKDVEKFVLRNKENLTEARKLTFAERLFLMIDESDGAACHSIIENVSFLYIASLLWQSDIYSPKRGGGLWEASTHDVPNPVRWILPPVPKPGKGVDNVSATTASVAALFTLLAQNRLVNPGACEGMKQLLTKKKRFPPPDLRGSLTKSFFRTGLRNAGIPFDNIFSKLGIGDFLNDGAIIERTVIPDPSNAANRVGIRYVAVACDDPTIEGDHLHKLIIELDKCIQENNGLITASTP